jgi:imidazolonepropionase-like amidohydrolase
MMFAYHQRLVKAMANAGVKLLPGTDSSFFGSAVHDELAEFVKAGLTPMQALQTATRNSADYFGKLDSMGTIEKGKLADLDLLDANPLADIENVRKISAVVINEHLLDRKELDRMLSRVESTNQTVGSGITWDFRGSEPF